MYTYIKILNLIIENKNQMKMKHAIWHSHNTKQYAWNDKSIKCSKNLISSGIQVTDISINTSSTQTVAWDMKYVIYNISL
jgi:hypothetical protein